MRIDKNGRGKYLGYEFVNLKLEGAAKNLMFATCNLGAEKEIHRGNYYQFGCCKEFDDTCDGYNNGIDLYRTDPCTVKMGGLWRLPTKEELESLLEQTKVKCGLYNGVRGFIFKKEVNGKTRKLFFPSTYYQVVKGQVDFSTELESCTYIWTSSYAFDEEENCLRGWALTLEEGLTNNLDSFYGKYGHSIRGVFKIC